jgi:hypothetical protein
MVFVGYMHTKEKGFAVPRNREEIPNASAGREACYLRV